MKTAAQLARRRQIYAAHGQQHATNLTKHLIAADRPDDDVDAFLHNQRSALEAIAMFTFPTNPDEKALELRNAKFILRADLLGELDPPLTPIQREEVRHAIRRDEFDLEITELLP